MTDKQSIDIILESLGVDEEDILYDVIEFAYDMMPYVGKVRQHYKYKRLAKRLNDNEEELIKIKLELEKSNHFSYYKEKVFPLFFEDIFNEHEDKKVKYILSGFKNIVQTNTTIDEEYLTLFDTLRELRAHEVLLLTVWARGSIDEFKDGFSGATYNENNEIINSYAGSKFDRLGLTNPIVSIQGRGRFTDYGVVFMRFLNDYENITQNH